MLFATVDYDYFCLKLVRKREVKWFEQFELTQQIECCQMFNIHLGVPTLLQRKT